MRAWARQADIDDGDRDGVTSAEKAELARLRRDNRVLCEERDIQAGDGLLREGDLASVFPFIEAEKAKRGHVIKAYQLLEVSSAFYDRSQHTPGPEY